MLYYAKSLQSCPTLCDPIDSSLPGSPVPGILQARTLEWVAISFSNAWTWKVKVKSLSRVRLLATPWTAAHQAPPSMGFSRQEYWSGVPLPSPTDSLRIYIYTYTWNLNLDGLWDPTRTLCNSLLFFPYLLWSHPNDLRPTYWLTDQLEQIARTQPGCTWGCACSRCGGALSLSEAWEAGTVLSSPSCSSICCSSVTTRKQNLFITCLLFSNIYTFYCSMGWGGGRELLKSQWAIWPIIVKIKRWYQFWFNGTYGGSGIIGSSAFLTKTERLNNKI